MQQHADLSKEKSCECCHNIKNENTANIKSMAKNRNVIDNSMKSYIVIEPGFISRESNNIIKNPSK